ncbi:MAG: tRNA (guanosine(46)-N7)-methyltransferase TrmB [Clostridia bacterium]|nr:tRNA (guanosine(46)-N7)-methyltransferase TrmB [Clostridia bacterium]
MRMRRKKHGAERIAACAEILIAEPTVPAVSPNVYFPIQKPIHMEIGCGKGDFAVGMAAKYNDCNWIAMERVPDVACVALEKAMIAKDSRPDNLRFLIGDAKNLTEWFLPHSVDCIYLNFSDPWPKKGYAKRRLTHGGFLELYCSVLRPGGLLRLKTDNEGLFDFSLEQFAACGLTVEWQTRDLHHSEKADENIMTEYERNFSEKGQVIYSAWVRFPGKDEKTC